MEEILSKKKGKKIILLGNEAIVRGALEAGVQFVSTYPGTPASEIGNTFYNLKSQISKSKNSFYFEYSVNEKVALETAMGASFSGLKTLVAMKHFGLNVCQDALLPFVYAGSLGPTVIVVADDPSCYSSAQSEQNSRIISYLAHIPTLEPADPQECKDFTKLAFEISKKFKIPVLVRITTRVAHQRAPVVLAELRSLKPFQGKFKKDPRKFITMPPRVLEMKEELWKKIEKIKELSEKNKINIVEGRKLRVGNQSLGIIVSGVSYLYVMEAQKELGISLPVLKLGFFYPLPEEKIKKFLKKLRKVLVIEELEPLLEEAITRMAKEVNPNLKIYGQDLLSPIGELDPDKVLSALVKFTNRKFNFRQPVFKIQLPKRFPQPCPGCPYWLAFAAIKKGIEESGLKKEEVVFGGDIGCYMLAGSPIIDLQDYLFCMGSSIGIAHGIKKALRSDSKRKLIALIGDSTFFHAGIPALINTVFNQSNPLIIIMDNQITAMTGQQPNPGQTVKIEEVVSACGVKNLKVISPLDQKAMIKTIKEFLKKKEVSVIISRYPCKFIR